MLYYGGAQQTLETAVCVKCVVSGVADRQTPPCSCLFFWQECTLVLLHYAYLQKRDKKGCHA